jgi:methionyl-tRNA formyltransferase
MKLVVFSYTNFGIECLEFLKKNIDCELLVVSAPADKGSALPAWGSTVEYCNKNNIQLVKNQKKKICPETINKVTEFSPDLIFSCYYPLIIPDAILNSSRLGGINFHGGILPTYKGCLSSVWSIINGEQEAGATAHFMDSQIDCGDVIEIKKCEIDSDDTAFSLYHKVKSLSFELFTSILTDIENIPRRKQDSSLGQYYGRALPYQGEINWNWESEKIEKFVRSMYFPPFLPAQCELMGQEYYLEKCHVENFHGKQAAGTVISNNHNQITVKTKDGAISFTPQN